VRAGDDHGDGVAGAADPCERLVHGRHDAAEVVVAAPAGAERAERDRAEGGGGRAVADRVGAHERMRMRAAVRNAFCEQFSRSRASGIVELAGSFRRSDLTNNRRGALTMTRRTFDALRRVETGNPSLSRRTT
jgi:hypothetical protein